MWKYQITSPVFHVSLCWRTKILTSMDNWNDSNTCWLVFNPLLLLRDKNSQGDCALSLFSSPSLFFILQHVGILVFSLFSAGHKCALEAIRDDLPGTEWQTATVMWLYSSECYYLFGLGAYMEPSLILNGWIFRLLWKMCAIFSEPLFWYLFRQDSKQLCWRVGGWLLQWRSSKCVRQ